jgi:hypothetical protein
LADRGGPVDDRFVATEQIELTQMARVGRAVSWPMRHASPETIRRHDAPGTVQKAAGILREKLDPAVTRPEETMMADSVT